MRNHDIPKEQMMTRKGKRKWTVDDIGAQQGKTAIITGANSGIGFEAAKALAAHGATALARTARFRQVARPGIGPPPGTRHLLTNGRDSHHAVMSMTSGYADPSFSRNGNRPKRGHGA
jgi:hypothetical protein